MATVTIACKLPHGLKMRLFAPQKIYESVMGGGTREVTIFKETGAAVTVNGWAYAQNQAPHCQINEGFALTMGVDKSFWDAWLEQNKDTELVKNGVIWAFEKQNDVVAKAKDYKEVKGGMERLDPNAPPKIGGTVFKKG